MSDSVPLGEQLASVEATVHKLELAAKAHRSSLVFTFGAAGCFYGRYLPYSVLFWHSFSKIGWVTARCAIRDLWFHSRAAWRAMEHELPAGLPTWQEAGVEVQQTLEHVQGVHSAFEAAQQGDDGALEILSVEMQSLQGKLGLVKQLSNAALAAAAELGPQRVLNLVRVFRHSFMASLTSALTHSVEMLGIGFNIGDTVAAVVNRLTAPRVRRLVDIVVAQSGDELHQLREDEHVGRFIQRTIRAFCNSLGIATAFYVESVVFPFVNAHLGAKLMADEIIVILTRKGILGPQQDILPVMMATHWTLCIGGLYYQFVLGSGGVSGIMRNILYGAPKLPGLVRLGLGAILVGEAWLGAAVAARRAGLLDEASNNESQLRIIYVDPQLTERGEALEGDRS